MIAHTAGCLQNEREIQKIKKEIREIKDYLKKLYEVIKNGI